MIPSVHQNATKTLNYSEFLMVSKVLKEEMLDVTSMRIVSHMLGILSSNCSAKKLQKFSDITATFLKGNRINF